MAKELARAFTTAILDWYRNNKRDLPWRRTRDPYKIWVSEVMLQQTTVKAVLQYYKKWLKQYPSVQSLAEAEQEDVLKAWQGLGYYGRVRNLHKTAKIIVNDFNARIPNSPEDLKKLPGFGPYTIGAVLSIAYDIRNPIVDANIRRIFMRLLAVRGKAVQGMDRHILPTIDRLVPQRYPGDFNQGLMELGALICRSREPLCNQCPVKGHCKAFEKGIQEVIPQPKTVLLKKVRAVLAIIRGSKGALLMQRRPPTGLLAGMWEFPGGKIKTGESPQKALEREIREELGIRVVVGKKVCDVVHYYTKFKVFLNVFECKSIGELKARSNLRWIKTQEFTRCPMPSGSAKIVNILKPKSTK